MVTGDRLAEDRKNAYVHIAPLSLKILGYVLMESIL